MLKTSELFFDWIKSTADTNYLIGNISYIWGLDRNNTRRYMDMAQLS